jgi:holliday junction DNA helicase RuvB
MAEHSQSPNVVDALKPTSLASFLGQEKVKERLQLAIEAAKLRNEPVEHILLLGPPGVGKATLASVIAKSVGVDLVVTNASALDKAGHLCNLLTKLDKRDVLFIDEIHRLPKLVVEYLVLAASDFRLDVVLDRGPNAHSVRLNLPRFTLIGTANRAEQVSHSLRVCFPIKEELFPYPSAVVAAMLEKVAQALEITIDADAIGHIAQSGNGIPLTAINLLKRVRDYALVKRGADRITLETAVAAIAVLVDNNEQKDSSGRLRISSEVRMEVWRRDGGKCVKCGSRENLEYDHIIPIAKGGSNTARNIELLCEACNRVKSDTIQ